MPLSEIRTMSAWMARSIDTTRFSTFLASLFAVVALILGMVGIYSVLAYIVSQRQREIAVRITLGATAGTVMRNVLRRALVLAGAGIAVGSFAAWLLTRRTRRPVPGCESARSTRFRRGRGDLRGGGAGCRGIPAFRTTRVNPVVALTSS